MSLTSAGSRKLVFAYQAQMLLQVSAGLIVTPIVVSAAGATAYGAWLFVCPLLGYLTLLETGIPPAVLRQVASYADSCDAEGRIAALRTGQALTLASAAAVALAGAVLWFAVPLPAAVRETRILGASVYWWALGTQTLATGLASLGPGLTGAGHGLQVSLAAMGAALISAVTSLTLALSGAGIAALVLGQLAAGIIGAVGVATTAVRRFGVRVLVPAFDQIQARALWRPAGAMLVNALAVRLVFYTDEVVLGAGVGTAAVASLVLTRRVPDLVQGFVWKYVDGHVPQLTAAVAGGRREWVASAIMRIQLLSVGITAAAIGAYAVTASAFMERWVGPDRYAGPVVASMLVWLVIWSTWLHSSGALLLAANRVGILTRMGVIEGLLNLMVSIALVRPFGIAGVLLGTVVAQIPTCLVFAKVQGECVEAEVSGVRGLGRVARVGLLTAAVAASSAAVALRVSTTLWGAGWTAVLSAGAVGGCMGAATLLVLPQTRTLAVAALGSLRAGTPEARGA
jgi:O-antigen/teichoic acid export membrane protein